MQVDLSSALAVVAALVSLAGTAIAFGAMKQKIDQLYTERAVWREEMTRKTDALAIADQALILRLETMQTRVVDTYMPKPDIMALENRVSDKQKELVGKVDKLDTKLDQVVNILLERKAA